MVLRAAAILVAAALAVAGIVASGAAQPARPTGSIRGRLDVRRLAAVPTPRPTVGELGGRPPRGVPDLRPGLVYLEEAPRGAFEDFQPGRAVMDQRRETFVPRLLAITTGSTVDFPNSDSTFHNVFSLSRPKRFDLGRYAAGKSKSVRFDRPGVVRVFCDIHSHMSAFIVVFNHPYFRVTDVEGRFRIDNIPAGTYNVVGWYEGDARVQRPVSVSGGAVTELDLVVP
jgi:plastocyanin